MRITIFTTILLLLALMTSCEKNIANEEKVKETTPSSDTNTINNGVKDGALIIAKAQEAEEGTQICVKGYIIASTQQSINNLCIVEPFVGSSAIVLGTKKVTIDGDEASYEGEVFPVCLTDASKGIRESFNLEKNPQYWNCYVYIYGTREQYMNMPGLKKVQSIEVDPDHVPEADETDDDNNDDSGNNDNPENDDPAPDDNNGGEGDNNQGDNNQGDNSGTEGDNSGETIPNEDDSNTSSALTIAQAKVMPEYTTCTVEGYIVAAASNGEYPTFINYSFGPSFGNNDTAILLADKPYDASIPQELQFDLNKFSDLFSVCTYYSNKEFKKVLNLVNHPENQNKRIRIKGRTQDYLGTRGMKEIKEYEFIE